MGGSLCTVHTADALKLRDKKGGEGQQRETAVARWSPICFQVADCCCTGQSARYRVCERERKSITPSLGNESKQLFPTFLDKSLAFLLLIAEALYAAQGQKDPAVSGNCPIWISGPAGAGGHKFPCSSLRRDTMQSYRTLRRI